MSKMFSNPTIKLLHRLHFRAEAKHMISVIPLGSIYWEDEMPDLLNLIKLSEDEQKMIWRIFAIRFKVWDGEPISAEEQLIWDAAQFEAPNWALFRRLSLSAEDRTAREEAEIGIQKEFEEFFGDADEVQIEDEGQGLQSWSATFDLTKIPPEKADS